jgi:uncharacterized RDD family membrane protein YckC
MTSPLKLASFSRRVGAGVIDFLIVLIYIQSVGWLATLSKSAALVLVLPVCLVPLLYHIALHALFGQTIGKHVARIRVNQKDGSPIGVRQAILRSSVDALFSVHWLFVVGFAVLQLPSSQFTGQGWSDLYQTLQLTFPPHFETVVLVSGVWGWSEFITMFFSKQRRAIHDYIAGTVVVEHERKVA